MNSSNYYDILGVSKNSSSEEIKKSYRKLSFQYHPDRNKSPDANQKMTDINNAYQILSDTNKRKSYDHQIKYGLPNDDASLEEFGELNNLFTNLFKEAMKSPPDINGSSSFAFFMPGMMPGSGMMPGPGMFPGMIPNKLSPNNNNNNSRSTDFLSELFGTQPPNFQECITPEPIILDHTISFHDSYNGTKHSITYERWVIFNTRRISEKKTIYFDIKPGINDNEVIIIENEGNFIDKNNIGTVEIIICIDNNTPFLRNGNDLIFKKTISFKESLCGFSFVLDHISGKSFAFNNNNDDKCTLIYNGFQKIINNYGFNRDNNTGNLIIIFDVTYPTGLTSDQINSIREII